MDHSPPSPGTVVVGIDGSSSALLALDWAADQAGLDHRELTLVHATATDHEVLPGRALAGLADLVADTQRAARTLLDDAATRVGVRHPDLVVHRFVSPAEPRTAMLGLAADAAMVVLGSHGRGPLRSLLLGSVGLAVSRLAPCPVVVIRPRPSAVVRRGVLVGLDVADASHPAVELAYRLASSRGWPLTVLQCFADGRSDTADDPDRLRALGKAVATIETKFPDVVTELVVEHGFLDEGLVRLSLEAEVVVVGATRTTRFQQVIYGSLAPTVVEHASGVVVVVPEKG